VTPGTLIVALLLARAARESGEGWIDVLTDAGHAISGDPLDWFRYGATR
jgi:hypothetical protein